MHMRAAILTFATGLFMTGAAIADAQLVMVEERGCIWCARWNEEIAPIYPKTDVGKTAPLTRININDTPPDGMQFDGKFRFTPTFVLLEDGAEIGRIEGYPGEDFFWGVLEKMIVDADLQIAHGKS